jgi:hypothetical protein
MRPKLPSGPKTPYELLDAALAAAEETRGERKSIGLNLNLSLYLAAQRAARARGMSLAAYARRALAAFISFDLGEDYLELMEEERGVNIYGSLEKATATMKPRGRGFGPWKIEGLSDYGD